ncbi:MAG: hypothetical protein EOO04_06630, partial [Chitinophagaceae bacterium]
MSLKKGDQGSLSVRFPISSEPVSRERKFIFLINPISGIRKKDNLNDLIAQRMEKHNFSFRILPTDKDGNYAALAKKIKSEHITDVVICGGDGTVNSVV